MGKLKGFVTVLIVFMGACSSTEQEITVFSVSYIFNESDQGWKGDFADYPAGDSVTYELFFKHDTLPKNLNPNGTTKALYLKGKNISDDLFMFVKKKISGLRPNATYTLLFNVKLASNAPTGTVGVAGAPGEGVFLKMGATIVEPQKQLEGGIYRMNIDKGNQAADGADMMNIGHIAVGVNNTTYAFISRYNSSSDSFVITTDDSGEIWLIIGTDSDFAGATALYYSQVDVLFNQEG